MLLLLSALLGTSFAHDPDTDAPAANALQGTGLVIGGLGRSAYLGTTLALPTHRGSAFFGPAPLAAGGATLLGDAFLVAGLEASYRELRGHGLDPVALRVGEAMTFGGAGLMAVGAGMAFTDDTDASMVGWTLVGIGAGLQQLAIVPLGIQTRRTQRVRERLAA
jgi:hypothetical protein